MMEGLRSMAVALLLIMAAGIVSADERGRPGGAGNRDPVRLVDSVLVDVLRVPQEADASYELHVHRYGHSSKKIHARVVTVHRVAASDRHLAFSGTLRTSDLGTVGSATYAYRLGKHLSGRRLFLFICQSADPMALLRVFEIDTTSAAGEWPPPSALEANRFPTLPKSAAERILRAFPTPIDRPRYNSMSVLPLEYGGYMVGLSQPGTARWLWFAPDKKSGEGEWRDVRLTAED